MAKSFNRRLYSSFSDFLADLRYIFSRRAQIGPLMRGERLDPAFRERLMLAVTAVNGCRYCSYVHTRQALAQGIFREEIEALGRCEAVYAACPPEQAPALLYAQHWAEMDARPDAVARQRLVGQFDPQSLAAIDLALHTIRVGNLLGNLLDYILYRVSFGRYNIDRPPRMGRRASS